MVLLNYSDYFGGKSSSCIKKIHCSKEGLISTFKIVAQQFNKTKFFSNSQVVPVKENWQKLVLLVVFC